VNKIRRIVLDVLKPHSPSIVELSKKVAVCEGVQGVNCTIEEVDQETESLRVTIEGDGIDYEKVVEAIRASGAVIHSIDSVSCGKKLVEESRPQIQKP
jgi:hypothetical protein